MRGCIEENAFLKAYGQGKGSAVCLKINFILEHLVLTQTSFNGCFAHCKKSEHAF